MNLFHGSNQLIKQPEIRTTKFNKDLFIDGKYSRTVFWELAKFKYPTHQISFHTKKALNTLEFIEGELINADE